MTKASIKSHKLNLFKVSWNNISIARTKKSMTIAKVSRSNVIWQGRIKATVCIKDLDLTVMKEVR